MKIKMMLYKRSIILLNRLLVISLVLMYTEFGFAYNITKFGCNIASQHRGVLGFFNMIVIGTISLVPSIVVGTYKIVVHKHI
jgi:hypothetical protein